MAFRLTPPVSWEAGHVHSTAETRGKFDARMHIHTCKSSLEIQFPCDGNIECFHSCDYRPYWYTETKESIWRGLVWDTNMAAVSLFWDTNMAAVTSCENTLFEERIKWL